jgi:hypothetical protein
MLETMAELKDETSATRSLAAVQYEPYQSGLTLTAWLNSGDSLLRSYEQELAVKHAIVGDLPNNLDRNTLLLYMSAWKTEPYITREWQRFQSLVNP